MEDPFAALIIFFVVLFVIVTAIQIIYAYIYSHLFLIISILTAIILTIALIFFFRKSEEKRKIREAEQRRLKAEEKARQEQARLQKMAEEQQQAEYLKEIDSLRERSVDAFEKMPEHISQAHAALDQADVDFEETAYSPFWRCIERSANEIGLFYDCIHVIGENRKRYREILGLYKAPPPEFPIHSQSVTAMHSVDTATKRMDDLVRKAQRDFHFSTIYEQIKTQEVLIAGFRTLSGALEHLSARVGQSINALGELISDEISRSSENISRSIFEASMQMGENIKEVTESISESIQETGGKTAVAIEQMNASAKESSAAILERHDRALHMLDNIQRRRRIFPTKIGDESY